MSERGRLLSANEKKFFQNFFQRLSDIKIEFVYLRNYADFPEKIGNDIDIFFRRKDVGIARHELLMALHASGGQLIHRHDRDYVSAVWFNVSKDEPSSIHLDFYHGAFSWHGLPYLTDREFLSQTIPYQTFQIPRPAHEAANLYLTSLLWGGFFKSRYQEQIAHLIGPQAEQHELNRILQRWFGLVQLPSLVDPPAVSDDRRHAKKLRQTFKRRSYLQNPFSAAFRQLRYWMKELTDMLNPPGIHVAILGPDGSGKSTVIAALKPRLEYYFGETVEGHWRPSLLPDIGVLFGKRKKSSGPATDPHGQRPHSLFMALFRSGYYWIDYWIGYPLRIWKPKAKNHLVIYDRYAADMWCDPRRYRLKLPSGVLKFFCRLVPQPDFTFVLIADAEIIHRRKGEIPLAALREVLKRYAAVPGSFPRIHAIDCNRPVDIIAEEIAGIVKATLQKVLPDIKLDLPLPC